jgi:SAM-dependent methyltransferase
LLAVYTTTIFVSAFLLFLVQPMFARMVLPLLGGSPAVWNTALVFYQGALLLGYGYAHLATKVLGPRRQAAIHVGFMLLPFLVLPVGVPGGVTPPATDNPAPWLLLMMAIAVGLPFTVVSASSPLLQRWFAETGHPQARDPYFLYAASNAGSLLALLAYPALIEPALRLREQSWLWTGGYALLFALMAGAAALLWRASPGGKENATPEDEPAAPLTLGRQARWVALAFVPSSLMQSVTTYLSTDVAAAPLLWIIPLSLYLITFILAFARRQFLPPDLARLLMAILVPGLALILATHETQPLLALLPLHLVTFFIVALVLHDELARDRPPARQLTQFYLLVSLGGVLGGVFNALLAPVIFSTIVEYPLTLVLACLLMPARDAEKPTGTTIALDVAFAVLLGVVTLLLSTIATIRGVAFTREGQALTYTLPALACILLARRPLRFGMSIGAVLLMGTLIGADQDVVHHTERSFFGVSRVKTGSAGYRQFFHGDTLHGLQDPRRPHLPVSYYHPTGPMGQVMGAQLERGIRRVAIVGLGAGAISAYAQPGQEWVFYEIDPTVLKIARDLPYFTYLRDCPAQWRVELGDARISLAAARDQFDFIVMDAYSSDAIPVHLITREALQLYLQRLAPGGVIAFHVSNRHLDLEPVVAELALDAGLVALVRSEAYVEAKEYADGKTPSQWMVVARRKEDFGRLNTLKSWGTPRRRPGLGVWTDDYSSILKVFLWD